ncbi:MAG: sigma-70 family RNA polymerase sigma factor [Bacteroidota bacterium]|nr:sigma-70 family RNA polymerase sigma factor [Bacteroidota bacterium]MDX5430579.1 sigma-70 family RNA polymerase sigma factor [Bacteroidota bacterium]MDX5469331.1 sigma-70 family RNA polymerase sigma factor [Bacteroidota bacterium]
MQEDELIARLQDPKSRNLAFSVLVDRYQERVYWHIRKMLIDPDETEDATQMTFIQVWQNLDTFRNDSKLFTWIYRIATNAALANIRSKKRRNWLSMDDAGDVLAQRVDQPGFFSGNEIEKKLFKALLRLPEKQKLVFQMKYFDDMKYEDISEVLGTSVGALKASYHHAVKKLEQYLSLP